MPKCIEKVRAGELITDKKFNELIDYINGLMGLTAEHPIELTNNPYGGRVIRAPGVVQIWLVEVVEQSGSTDDGVNYYKCKARSTDPSGSMVDGEHGDLSVYDPAGAGRVLSAGQLLYAVTNSTTGRWEAIVGGNGTPSSDCTTLGKSNQIPTRPVRVGDYPVMVSQIDNCFYLGGTTDKCCGGDSSSASSGG